MSELPVIRTAIPKRRYQLGAFSVSLLGEVESGDGIDYRYIMGFVAEGESRPSLYVCAERNPPGERGEGGYRLRVVNEVLSEVLGSSDAWGDLDTFAEQALQLAGQALSLTDEEPYRLM